MKPVNRKELFPDCGPEMQEAFEEYVSDCDIHCGSEQAKEDLFYSWISDLNHEEYLRMERFFDAVIDNVFVVVTHGRSWNGSGGNIDVYYDQAKLHTLIPNAVDLDEWGILDGWFYFSYSHHDGGATVRIRNLRKRFSEEEMVYSVFENEWKKNGFEAGVKKLGRACTKALKKDAIDVLENCY